MPLLPGGILPPEEPTIDIARSKSAQPGPVVLSDPSLNLKAQDPNAAAKLKAQTPTAATDPFAGLEEVQPTAPDAFSGLKEVAGDDVFAGLQEADRLDLEDEGTLIKDDSFSPAEYIAGNPSVNTDAAKSKKLLNIYRARRIRGLEAGKVVKAAITEAYGLVKKTVGGVVDLGARAIELGIQPAANRFFGFVTGTDAETQRGIEAEQGKAQLKAASEVLAGTETAVTGLGQLAQQGTRKLFGKAPEKQTDDELLGDLLIDAEFSKTMKALSEGSGDASKLTGLDAETLQKNGITLDKEAIERLSLVDPVTLVGTAGVFKVVGVAGKVLATAATRAGGEAVLNGLKTAAAKSIELTGRGVQKGATAAKYVAERVPGKSVGTIIGGVQTGTLTGAAVGAAAGETAKRVAVEISAEIAKKGGQLADSGRQLAPGFTGPKTAIIETLTKLPTTPVGQIAGGVAKGATGGAAAAALLALASDDSKTAGALLGGGIALVGIAGGVGATRKVAIKSIAKNYLDPANIPFDATNSPAYGTDAALDVSHEAAIQSLPPREQNAINTFREAVREAGGEIYVQDDAAYKQRLTDEFLKDSPPGTQLTLDQQTQVALYARTHAEFSGTLTDAQGNPRRVVFLRASAKGLPHDAGHLFQSLLGPLEQKALRESVFNSYSPEQIATFKAEYARRIGEPDYFTKLGEEIGNQRAADEIIAENFSQLFGNSSFDNLKAPRTFLQKLGQTAVNAGEALGLDLTSGRVTPNLGATPSFRVQGLLRNAAKEVLSRQGAPLQGPPTQPVAAPTVPTAPVSPIPFPTPRSPAPAAPAPITPAAILPKPAATPTPAAKPAEVTGAKNIRVERSEQDAFSARAEETGIAEAQKATESNPETRATVDTIAQSMQEQGNPVLEIEHRGIASERGPGAPEGRTSRRGTQAQGYEALQELQIENRKNAPADIVNEHQKTFVPVRFTTQGGKPTLIAMSLDKVISNISRVVSDTASKGAEALLPYPMEGGKLTDAGWKQSVADLKTYAENQSNGYRGDGQKLVRPTEDIGVSIPAENPNYTPVPLSEAAMNFANLIQGLNPPETARVTKGQTPGNVKGQVLAEVNAKQPLTPTVIKPENVGAKQKFKGFEPRTIKETNPLRNELAARGVKVRELIEVTERIAVEDIAKVNPRPDINFKAPVTDTIRGGFLPGDTLAAEVTRRLEEKKKSGIPATEAERLKTRREVEFDQRNGRLNKPAGEGARFFLPDGTTLEEFGRKIIDAPVNDKMVYGPRGLTIEAYDLGLKLMSPEDVIKLTDFAAEASAKFREKMVSGDLDNAMPYASRAQFFNEAIGAATDTGSAANPTVGWRRAFPDGKPPFAKGATEATPTPNPGDKGELGRSFLPAEEIAKDLDPIAQAAIRTENGEIYTGAWHGEALMNFVDASSRGETKQTLPEGVRSLTEVLDSVLAGNPVPGFIEDGFTTKSGKFLNRADALAHAEKIKQLKGTPEKGTLRAEGLLESDQFKRERSFLPGDERALTGLAFKDFFSSVTKGEFGKSEVPWVPLKDITPVKGFAEAQAKHSGNFDEHIAKSIPSYRETQFQKGDALVKTYPEGARVLDVGGSEGSWNKAITSESGGKIETVVVDPNPDMAAFFREKSSVPGSSYQEAALGASFEDGGKVIPEFKDKNKFDVVNESMVFQFISPDRAEQVKSVKGQLKPDGIFLSDEKLRTSPEVWKQNEQVKDTRYKKVYFSPEELKAKDTVVGFQQPKSETKAVGMVDNMATLDGYESILKDNFKHVVQYWDSGNFKGYVSSDSLPAIDKFLSNLGDTSTEFSTTALPRTVERSFLPEGKTGIVPEDVKPRAIRATAVRLDDGTVVEGQIHAIAIGNALRRKPYYRGEFEDGFITNAGEFLNRADALIRAEDIKQLDKGKGQIQSLGALESVEFRENRNFLPGDVKPKGKGGKRDERGRPLTRDGLIDYPKLTKENAARQAKEDALTDFSKYAVSEEQKPTSPKPTGWILPDGEFVPLDEAFHQDFLARHSEKLNAQFGTSFESASTLNDRLSAINKGFVRVRDYNGATAIELNQKFYKGDLKKAIEDRVLATVDSIDKLRVSLLDDAGQVVDSGTARLFDSETPGPDALAMLQGLRPTTSQAGKKGPSAIQRARAFGGDFLPSDEQTLPGFNEKGGVGAEQQLAIRNRVAESKNYPEALPLEFAKEGDGSYRLQDGKPVPIRKDYALSDSPLAKEAAKGVRGEGPREEAFTDALSERLVKTYEKAVKNPEIKAGEKWYSTARTRLKKLLGPDAKLFAELLGATSARTAVNMNFGFALEAYNQFKSGAYDGILDTYREGKRNFEKGAVGDFPGGENPTRTAYLDWWITEKKLTPLQSNGKKFGMNSRPVLKVLDGSWAAEVGGPKTPNFTGNLSGTTFEATIDIWAMRMLHRLANVGNEKRWRIQPGNETGVTDVDFFTGQKAFRKAAEALAIKPDALQAVLWFAEKDFWEKQGWTLSKTSSGKTDFNSLLAKTVRTPEGTLKKVDTSGLQELDFGLSVDDVKPKKK